MNNVLVFTDSRGQHKPAGQSHQMFGERLVAEFGGKAVLCPMKWTTTLDFLQFFPPEVANKFGAVILYTGIVEWSPRPFGSAVKDLYDCKTVENLQNLELNTSDYSKKIVNNKKKIFDEVFGESRMATHFSSPFEQIYEGERTINMYGLEMAQDVIRRLQKYENLIFVSANRIISDWRGDYKKDRPRNMDVTHAYSSLFSQSLERVVDLRAWSDSDIKKFTCDNLHLNGVGSDYIYGELRKILVGEKLSVKPALATSVNIKTSKVAMNTIESLDVLVASNRSLRNGDAQQAFEKALAAFQVNGRTAYFHAALTAAFRLGGGSHYERLLKAATSHNESEVPSGNADHRYLKWVSRILLSTARARVKELAARPELSPNDLVRLEEKLTSELGVTGFLDAREKTIAARMREEFELLRSFPLPFPYNYISDYRSNVGVPKGEAPTPKSVTFIYPIKDRSRRVMASLRSLAQAANLALGRSSISIDVVVVEDESASELDTSVLERASLPFDVTHLRVTTNVRWTRSGLINRGIEVAKGQFLFFTDADVLFPSGFILAIQDALNSVDLGRHLVAVNMFETHSHRKEGEIHGCGVPYSYMWGILRKHAKKVGGFNESYIGWGSEDRDFEHRACKDASLSVLSTFQLPGRPYVFHLSHDTRTGDEEKEANKRKLAEIKAAGQEKPPVVPRLDIKQRSLTRVKSVLKNRETYQSLFLDIKSRKEKTLVILGNGPSLREVMESPESLRLLKSFDTFGLNAAYRAYDRFGFYPTYFGSFDFRVCDSHKDAYSDLIRSGAPIKKYFFAKPSVFDESVRAHPKFQNIVFRAAPQGISRQKDLSRSFDDFQDCGSSGTNAVQAGYIMGYRHFVLLGVDCNYVEIIDGVKDLDGIRYEVVNEIQRNPNYWFDDYQRIGDQFHKPNEESIQLTSWAKLNALAAADDVSISNCSEVTKLKMYPVLPLATRTTSYRNIFLVMSCKKYTPRIEVLRSHYVGGMSDQDLVLYVQGGHSRGELTRDGVLRLPVGDMYEDLPEKVQAAVEFCVRNLNFERLVKVDDDVFVNFEKFYAALEKTSGQNYVGRRTPTRAGIVPSSTWHFGKVSEESFDADVPHAVESPPDVWAGGGMYVLSREAAALLCGRGAALAARGHLYEDFMVGDILFRQGVNVEPWADEAQILSRDWCITNLKEILDDQLDKFKDKARASNAISVHCGPYRPYYDVDETKLKRLFEMMTELVSLEIAA